MKIDKKSTIHLNGFPMRLHIWGEDETNPIIIFVHGGPGNPFRHKIAEYLLPLAKDYTLVAYDERGTGGSYRSYITLEDLTIEGYVDDLLGLAKYVLKKFNQEKLYIVGESFGSYISTEAVLKNPNLFKAYIGYGQTVDDIKAIKLQYKKTFVKAKQLKDYEAIDFLREIGYPKNGFWDGDEETAGFLYLFYNYVTDFGKPSFEEREERPFFESPENSKSECRGWVKGKELNMEASKKFVGVNYLNKNIEFKIPYYVFQGRLDMICPYDLLPKYIEEIKAPKKELLTFENTGHLVAFEQPKKFMRELRKRFNEKALV